ncbi:MAG: DUF1963 domain-containing protein [Bacteroidales bacterium]|nr:DUF1963 domain-containing protein [Bacteroidales bacterium]
MAIRLTLNKTERILFCGSKWWGDPDMPENMQYPVMQVTEDGETYDYPLTFVCQINCEDIAKYDKDGKLPHEGMLYFFAAVDDYIGYESPVENPMGEWPKGRFVVKYAKTINFETFQTCMLVGDEDEQLTEPELEITFSECENDEACIKMLAEVAGEPDHISLLQLNSDAQGGIDMQNQTVDLIIKESDLGFGNWKRAKAVMTQSEK